MHAMQVKHMKLKAQIKGLQTKVQELELEGIKLGLAERQPHAIEEFRWPKAEVIERWGAGIWDSYKRERIEERFKWK